MPTFSLPVLQYLPVTHQLELDELSSNMADSQLRGSGIELQLLKIQERKTESLVLLAWQIVMYACDQEMAKKQQSATDKD